MSINEPSRFRPRRRTVVRLSTTLRDLSGELGALRQEVCCLSDEVRGLRTDLDDLRKQVTTKDEQVIVLRTQHRVLWAIASAAGVSSLGALVMSVMRLLGKGAP